MSTCNFEFFLPPQQAWSYIHVYMCIQIKLVHCSTLCNLVLYGEKRMYSHVARLKILFFVFVLCSWNDPKGKRIWGLVSICSLLFFSLFILCLYIKVKKVFYYWTLLVGLNYYRRVCDMQSVRVAKLFAHTHTCANTFLDISSYRQLGKFSWMTHYF